VSGLRIRLDLASTTPHYEQLRVQFAGMIHVGLLKSGDQLPTVRALANDLGIAPGTVARAYRDLEAGNLVFTRRRTGTVVRASAAQPAIEPLLNDFRHLVVAARREGLSDDQIRDVLVAALLQHGPDGEDLRP